MRRTGKYTWVDCKWNENIFKEMEAEPIRQNL